MLQQKLNEIKRTVRQLNQNVQKTRKNFNDAESEILRFKTNEFILKDRINELESERKQLRETLLNLGDELDLKYKNNIRKYNCNSSILNARQ